MAGFGDGFARGFGLADNYLNRQNDRRRQQMLDNRNEVRYQDGLTQQKLVNERNRQADVRAETKAAQDTTTFNDKQSERVLAETNRKRATTFHKWKALPNPEDPTDPKVIKYMRELNIMSELDIKDPGIAMAHYNKLNKAIQTGEFTAQDVVAANAVYGEAINQRPTDIRADKTVAGVDGKQFSVPAGSKITQRDIIGVTPAPDGKGFVMKLKIMATLPDGTEVEYIADATQAGSTDASAGPQVQQPQDFLAMNQLKQGIIQQIAKSGEHIRSSETANYENSELGKGQAIADKRTNEGIKAEAALVKAQNDYLKTAGKDEREMRKYFDGRVDSYFGTGKGPNGSRELEEKAAFMTSWEKIKSNMSKIYKIPPYKLHHLPPGVIDAVIARFKASYGKEKGFWENPTGTADHLDQMNLMLADIIANNEEMMNDPSQLDLVNAVAKQAQAPELTQAAKGQARIKRHGAKNQLGNTVTADSLDSKAAGLAGVGSTQHLR
jgi:hypothetical protein